MSGFSTAWRSTSQPRALCVERSVCQPLGFDTPLCGYSADALSPMRRWLSKVGLIHCQDRLPSRWLTASRPRCLCAVSGCAIISTVSQLREVLCKVHTIDGTASSPGLSASWLFSAWLWVWRGRSYQRLESHPRHSLPPSRCRPRHPHLAPCESRMGYGTAVRTGMLIQGIGSAFRELWLDVYVSVLGYALWRDDILVARRKSQR